MPYESGSGARRIRTGARRATLVGSLPLRGNRQLGGLREAGRDLRKNAHPDVDRTDGRADGGQLRPKPRGAGHAADAAREFADAAFSHFKVGAALETADGTVVSGCNIENAAYGLRICAERVAMFKALSEGHRAFTRIAIVFF